MKTLLERLEFERGMYETRIKEQGEELQTVKNRLEFERNMYEKQLRELRTGLIAGLKHNMKLELDDLEELAKGLNPSDGTILRMYVENIKQVISEL